jgi:phosphoserine phosphatase
MYVKLRDRVNDIDSTLINWVRGYCREMFGVELSIKEARRIINNALGELIKS